MATTEAAPRTAATPRRTVVVRAGPSRRKAMVVDVAVGLLGVALLVVAYLLLNALPRPDVQPTQYKVSFLPVSESLEAQSFAFWENGTASNPDAFRHRDFVFPIPYDDVYELSIQVSVADDVPASRPDQFRFEVYTNTRDSAEGHPTAIATAPGVQADNGTEFQSPIVSLTHAATVTQRPTDFIATVADNATSAQVESAVERAHRLLTRGNWTLRVTLVDAGDCDSFGPTNVPGGQGDVVRSGACAQETGGGRPQDAGKDLGNPFTVGVFTYTRFVVHAERLE